MRALKTLLITFLSLLVLAAGLALFGPAHTRVAASATIKAPPEVIHAIVIDARHWQQWTPWDAPDLRLKSNTGDNAYWSAQWTEGTGGMQGQLDLVDTGAVEWGMTLTGRYTASGQLALVTDPDDRGASVQWVFSSDNPPLRRIYLMMNDMEDRLAADLDSGLAKLAVLAEKEAVAIHLRDSLAAADGLMIELVDQQGMTCWGRYLPMAFAEQESVPNKALREMAKAIAKAKGAIIGDPIAVGSALNGSMDSSVVFIGWPVAAKDLPDDTALVHLQLAQGKALRVDQGAGWKGISHATAALGAMRGFMGLAKASEPVVIYTPRTGDGELRYVPQQVLLPVK